MFSSIWARWKNNGMTNNSFKIKHRRVNLNNEAVHQIDIFEQNSNFSWLCHMIEKPNQSYLKNSVHESFLGSTYKIIKEPSGRPILLKNNKKHTSISISHKENIYVIAQSLKKRHSVGVDVEIYNPDKDYSFIARSLSLNESLVLNEIQKKFSVDLNKSYLCIWTIKECLVKIFNKKADWHNIEVKISKHGHFQFYIKNMKLSHAKLKMYFYKNTIISVVFL